MLLENAHALNKREDASQALMMASLEEERADLFAGLLRPQKALPCKLFYDETGSQIFDAICELKEYYPTRLELRIMAEHTLEMASFVGPGATLVEYGSGSSIKTRLLLEHLPQLRAYVPIDISFSHLEKSVKLLEAAYPHIPILPVCADYTKPFELPLRPSPESKNIVAYFPGSTIGNFDPEQARSFLSTIRATCGSTSGLLIGVDLLKRPEILHAAYNDSQGVTAEFNLNILRRMNGEFGSSFDPSQFAHYAFFNPKQSRVEMHLVSLVKQTVDLAPGLKATFSAGEGIHTESSYKYTPEGFEKLAAQAGYRRRQIWTDPFGWFSVQYFEGEG